MKVSFDSSQTRIFCDVTPPRSFCKSFVRASSVCVCVSFDPPQTHIFCVVARSFSKSFIRASSVSFDQSQTDIFCAVARSFCKSFVRASSVCHLISRKLTYFVLSPVHSVTHSFALQVCVI